MRVDFRRVNFQFRSAFRIAYRTRTQAETVCLELREGEFVGRGEALGVSYRGETVEVMLDQLSTFASQLRAGVSRAELQHLLPAGGLRNAIDCALWDLEAKRAGRRAWVLAGVQSLRSIETTYTLGADAPDAMASAAAQVPHMPTLKLKLTGEQDLERVAAVRKARPDASLIVDANQAWTDDQLYELIQPLADLGVKCVEQPLPIGRDDVLLNFESPIALCADESCQTTASLAVLRGKYQYVNIKLDKAGGLTEALRLAQAARADGFKLMVGCMGGSSLSMAPAFVVAQQCDMVDLDGPLLIKADVPNAMRYDGPRMTAPSALLWG